MKNISQNTANSGRNANPLGSAVDPPAGKLFRVDQPIHPVPVKSVERAVGVVRIYYPKNAMFQGVSLNRGGKMLRSPLHKAAGFFCQTLPLTMKNTSQDAAETNSRHREIHGQKLCRRGWLGLVGLVVAVRSNGLPGKILRRSQSTVPGWGGYICWETRPAFRGQGGVIITFFGVRMYYRKNAISEGFYPDLAGITLFPPRTKQSKISVRLVS
jgi:hypothetical protein